MATSSTALPQMVPGLDLAMIRKTSDSPPRASVLDLIKAVCKVENPRKTWASLRKAHEEVVSEQYSFQNDYKFTGQGQNGSPVINASGAILIINLLPGGLAASFRGAWSSIIARYLGGDLTLTSEIEAINHLQSEVDDNHPVRFFEENVQAQGIVQHVKMSKIPREQFTMVVHNQNAIVSAGFNETGDPQAYTGIPQQLRLPPDIVPEGATIIKFGYTTDGAQRIESHRKTYGGFEFLDNFPCANAYAVERRWRRFLIMRGKLIFALRMNGDPDTEMFWVESQEEWEEIAAEFKRLCDEVVDEYCTTGHVRLQLKLAESEVVKEKEKSRQIELEKERDKERTQQIDLETRRDLEKTKELATVEKVKLELEGQSDKERERTKQIEAMEKTKQGINEARVAEARVRQLELELSLRSLECAHQSHSYPVQAISTPSMGETTIETDGTHLVANTNRQLVHPTQDSPAPSSPPSNSHNVVSRPARRRVPNVPTDVREYPFQPFIDRYLEPEADMTRGLQWSALKTQLREWHSQEFPNEPRLNICLPKAVLDYFSSKLGGWHDTSRGGVKVKGFFGWRLHDNPVPVEEMVNADSNEVQTEVEVDVEAEIDGRTLVQEQAQQEVAREPNWSTIPPGDSAVERAELDIVRILNQITGTNRELGWEIILSRRNSMINKRAMTRARKSLLDSGRVFKRAVLGNSCVYSLIQ